MGEKPQIRLLTHKETEENVLAPQSEGKIRGFGHVIIGVKKVGEVLGVKEYAWPPPQRPLDDEVGLPSPSPFVNYCYFLCNL